MRDRRCPALHTGRRRRPPMEAPRYLQHAKPPSRTAGRLHDERRYGVSMWGLNPERRTVRGACVGSAGFRYPEGAWPMLRARLPRLRMCTAMAVLAASSMFKDCEAARLQDLVAGGTGFGQFPSGATDLRSRAPVPVPPELQVPAEDQQSLNAPLGLLQPRTGKVLAKANLRAGPNLNFAVRDVVEGRDRDRGGRPKHRRTVAEDRKRFVDTSGAVGIGCGDGSGPVGAPMPALPDPASVYVVSLRAGQGAVTVLRDHRKLSAANVCNRPALSSPLKSYRRRLHRALRFGGERPE